MSLNNNLDPFDMAKAWLKKNGGHVHDDLKRELKHELYGIFATAPILSGVGLVHVPKEICLGPQKYNQYLEFKKYSFKTTMDQSVCVFLAEFLKGSDSIYVPWFSILPSLKEFRNYHPLFSSKEELSALERLCPRVKVTLDNYRKKIDDFKNSVKNQFEIEVIEWAFVNYLTRAFEDRGFVPFCGLFNHFSPLGNGIIDDQVLLSGYSLEAGDEVYISYGDHIDTLELWMRFGFLDKRVDHCINCQTVSIDFEGVVFDQTCYIDAHGASPNLRKNCDIIAGGIDRDGSVFRDLVRSFLSEMKDVDHLPDTPIIKTCKEVLFKRRELLLSFLHK